MALLNPAKSATLVVKMLRWLFIWMAIRVSTRLHEASYVETVYGRNEKPPPLLPAIVNFFILLSLFHIAMLAIVNSLVGINAIPKSVRSYALTESAAYMLFIGMLSVYIASVVESKRYFNYRKDGIRAIRAFKELVLWSVFPISVSPIFFTT